MTARALLLSSFLLLTACGTTKEIVYRDHYVAVQPDGALRVTSPDKPKKPTLKTPNDVAQLIADLFAWGEGLDATNKAIWQSLDTAAADVDKLNKGN